MLGRLFGKGKKPAGATPLPKISSAVEGAILGIVGTRAIPTMPGAAQRAFQLSTNPNSEARDFVEVITSDESLSGRVIKIANSVFFDRGKRSNSIEEAVLVIGINELRSLLNASALSEIFPSSNPIRAQLWANDIATAILAKQLAQRFLPAKADTAFLGGLMHDVGKLLLLQRAPELYGKVLAQVSEEGCSFTKAEEKQFPFTHADVGQLVGERWRFTEELLRVIGTHHEPLPESREGLLDDGYKLAAIVSTADLLAHSFGWGHPRGFTKFQAAAEESVTAHLTFWQIPQEERRSFRETMKRSVESEQELYSGQQLTSGLSL